MQQIGIGLAGLGTVGAGVFKHLTKNRVLLMERLGLELVVKKIVARDWTKSRGLDVPEPLRTTRWQDLIDDPTVRIVCELMGGLDDPLALILRAIESKKIVVTGNKHLLAEHGREIFEAA